MSFNKKEVEFIIKSKEDGKSFVKIAYDFKNKFGRKISKTSLHRFYKKEIEGNKKEEEKTIEKENGIIKNITIPYRKDGKLQYSILSLDDVEIIQYSYVRKGSGLSIKDISEINFGNGKFAKYYSIELIREVIKKFNINKKDSVVSQDYFIEKIMQLDDKDQEKSIKEIKEKADKIKYSEDINNKYYKMLEKKNKDEQIHSNTMEYFLNSIEKISKSIKCVSNSRLKLSPIKHKKDSEKRLMLFITDLHIGRTSGIVKKNLEFILDYIKKGGYNAVDIYNLGDNFENLSGMQMHSNQSTEQDFFGLDQIKIASFLLSNLLLEIRKAGIKVSMNLISGNHDRFTSNFKEDTKQTGGAILGLLISLQTKNIDGISITYKNDQDYSKRKSILGIKNFSNVKTKNVNDLILDSGKFLYKYYDKDNILVVCHHGDANFNKFNTSMLSNKINDFIIGKLEKTPKYKIIVSGHNHDHCFEEIGKTIRIRCGSLNGANGYAIDSPFCVAGPSCFAMEINNNGYPEMRTLHMPDITIDELEKETAEMQKIFCENFSGNSTNIIID